MIIGSKAIGVHYIEEAFRGCPQPPSNFRDILSDRG